MIDSARTSVLSNPSIAVVKVGTNVLADAEGRLDQDRIRALSEQIAHVRKLGWKVVLVSSGAIGAGVGKLQLGKRPTDLPHLQACAAVGQSALMQLYLEAFSGHNILPAQILLTASDFDHRARYLNVRHTIHTLFEYACIPIINENDTVSVAEIKFGDNDQLAAMVANLLQAKLLVLLTNVNGLYTADPRSDASARLVPTVESIDSSVTSLAGTTRSELGTGGMKSKLKAARIATASGCAVIMANGGQDRVLDRVFAGEPVGTLFQPHGQHLPAWKRWLGFTAQTKGKLTVDSGARKALLEGGKSLLPVGVKAIEGEFGKGDPISICDETGVEIARGLSNYHSQDAARYAGLQSDQIVQRFGKIPYMEIVHRDNLAVTS
jgi:glutamate 5-kinase